MATQDIEIILANLAFVVGGTVSANNPYFYSGNAAGDGSGVAGVKGCFVYEPETIQDPPVGVLHHSGLRYESFGPDTERVDTVNLSLWVARQDAPSAQAQLTPFADLVPNALIAHFLLKNSASVASPILNAFVMHGNQIIQDFGGVKLLGWDFSVEIRRTLTPTFVA